MGLLRRQEDLIPTLSHKTGFVVTDRQGGRFDVRNADNRRRVCVEIRAVHDSENVTFQCWLGCRFSLETPPAGLFARVLMRSYDLIYAHWLMIIAESCEGSLCVSASIPRVALDADRFAFVMNEVIDERNAFDQELRDKFRYDVNFDRRPSSPSQGGANLPMPRNGSNLPRRGY